MLPGRSDSVIGSATLAALRVAHRPSHATTKRHLRGATINAVRAAIDAELTPEAYRSRGRGDVRLPGRTSAPAA